MFTFNQSEKLNFVFLSTSVTLHRGLKRCQSGSIFVLLVICVTSPSVTIEPYKAAVTSLFTIFLQPYTVVLQHYIVVLQPYTVVLQPYTVVIQPYTVAMQPYNVVLHPYNVVKRAGMECFG